MYDILCDRFGASATGAFAFFKAKQILRSGAALAIKVKPPLHAIKKSRDEQSEGERLVGKLNEDTAAFRRDWAQLPAQMDYSSVDVCSLPTA